MYDEAVLREAFWRAGLGAGVSRHDTPRSGTLMSGAVA